MLTEVLLLLILVGLLVNLFSSKNPKGLPPGPREYPVIGSAAILHLEDARRYRQQYGDIFRTKMGALRIVYLCTPKLIREAFSKPELADRPSKEAFHWMTEGRETGVIMTNGQRWQNARRFLLRNLRDLGMGKSRLDSAIQTEALALVQDFKKHQGVQDKFPNSLNVAVLNIIWQLVANRRYEVDDEEISEFLKLLSSSQEDVAAVFFLPEIFPILKHLPEFLKRRLMAKDKMDAMMKAAKNFMQKFVTSHRENLDPDNPKDLIDEYLVEMDRHTDMAAYFSEEDLMKNIMDLFGAGFDTTSKTLRWLMLYVAAHPEVQTKVQDEIDSVVGRGTLPCNTDRPKLPYLEATIHEVLRCCPIAPLGVFHSAATDTELGGYTIPKDMIVMGCIGLCHEDPEYWHDPHTFDPSRFLDDVGKFKAPKDAFMPFGVGRRQCLGEALARNELFIFSAALLQTFSFAPPPGGKIDLSPRKVPLGHISKEQEVVITARD